MPKDKSVPKPVITNAILTKIKDQLETWECIPECLPLQEYFKARIIHKNDAPVQNYPKAESAEIRALFPEVAETPNIDKLLEYYIINYPAYECLSERYINQTALKTNQAQVFNHWFKEFFCYLKVKVDELSQMLALSHKNDSKTEDASTMTNITEPNDWNISDFCVELMGPSNVVNNLVFMKMNDDVVLRYHKNKHLTSFNKDGSMDSLFNYPNIAVELNIGGETPLLSIKRTCECIYDRFIMNKCTSVQREMLKNVTEKKKLSSKLNPFIQAIELVEAKESVVYNYSFINEFMTTLIDLVKNCTDRVPDSLKQGLNFFLKEFLADIVELNLYNRKVFATNTSVKFIIGTTTYERYRFVQTSDVNFVEILTPLVTLHLKEFNPWYAIDQHQELYFKQLRLFAQNLTHFEDVLLKEDVLKFSCKVCGMHFNNSEGIIEHFQKSHEPVHGVVCEKCQLSLEVCTLAAKRWKHTCFE